MDTFVLVSINYILLAVQPEWRVPGVEMWRVCRRSRCPMCRSVMSGLLGWLHR